MFEDGMQEVNVSCGSIVDGNNSRATDCVNIVRTQPYWLC